MGLVIASPFPMALLWGPELIQIYNDGYREVLGTRHPGSLGQPTRECWPEAWDFNASIYERVLRGESFSFADQRFAIERSGRLEDACFTVAYSPASDESGDVGGVLVALFETTGRVCVQAALSAPERKPRPSEERRKQLETLDTILNRLQEFVCLLDLEGRLLYANQPLLDVWQLPLEQALGKNFFDLDYPNELAQALHAQIDQVIRTGRTVEGECSYVSPAGATGYYEYTFVPLLAPDGSVEAVGGQTRVVTERRQTEAALRESESRYRTLFESIDEGFCVIEMLFDEADRPVDYRFLETNPAFETHTGLANAVGRRIRELAPEHESHWFEIYGQVAQTGEPRRFERSANALGRYYDVYAFRVAAPELRRVAVLFNDITERKQAAEVLLESARRKDEFLATLAHELRNPLAPIVNAIEVLRLREDDPAAVERARETIRRQVDHMRHLVDDLLDVARITRGMVNLQVETVDLGSVLTSAVQMVRPLIDRRGQELTVSVPLAPVQLEGDPHRLTQVVTNLLTNAAKFTPVGGQITVTAEHLGAEAVIRVEDTGKGIPAEMLPHVFDLFTQVNPSIDRAEGGLGLGLTLVQKLTEMHGGRVEGHSAGPGLGSEFVVRLPAHPLRAVDNEPVPSPPRSAELPQLMLLVVDDNLAAADTLAELLPLWGHQVRVAYTGLEALTMAKESRPDAVLLDIGLPGMDGYAVARRIREDPELRSVQLVALTGFGQDEDRQRAREAGFDEHLTKPVDLDELRQLLEGVRPR
ncbi:MAG: PAS domain-containing protein [Actinomycetota bacterium]